jgi:methionyl-tRNA formyltransferase
VKIAFFGLPLGALLLAEDGHELNLAVLSPVAAPGRRRLARRIGKGRVVDGATLGASLDAAVLQRLEREPTDLVVSFFWTRLLPARVLRSARLGAVGVHPSLLPRHRGRNPYFWAIDSGDRETGVTVHELGEGYDDGAILATERIAIGELDSWQLARALDRPMLALLRKCVARSAAGEHIERKPQDEQLVTWAPEPSGDLLRVDWRWPSERVLRRIRALAPVPGLALEVAGIRLFVTRAREALDFPRALEPGEAAVVDGGVLIRTGDAAIELEKVVLGLFEPKREAAMLEPGQVLDGSELARLVATAAPISRQL